MATWMTHLRIADLILDQLPELSPVEFIVGNLAPDSGVPSGNGTGFVPDTTVSHFRTNAAKADPEAYVRKYAAPELRSRWNSRQQGFYLGYLTHLMTDVLWSQRVALPVLRKYGKEAAPDREDFLLDVKADWYDLDFRFLRDHPGFRAFRVYLGAVGFRNDFMEEFTPEAFENRRQYITDFYLQPRDNLDRIYPYLKEAEMHDFVMEAVSTLVPVLRSRFLT